MGRHTLIRPPVVSYPLEGTGFAGEFRERMTFTGYDEFFVATKRGTPNFKRGVSGEDAGYRWDGLHNNVVLICFVRGFNGREHDEYILHGIPWYSIRLCHLCFFWKGFHTQLRAA